MIAPIVSGALGEAVKGRVTDQPDMTDDTSDARTPEASSVAVTASGADASVAASTATAFETAAGAGLEVSEISCAAPGLAGGIAGALTEKWISSVAFGAASSGDIEAASTEGLGGRIDGRTRPDIVPVIVPAGSSLALLVAVTTGGANVSA